VPTCLSDSIRAQIAAVGAPIGPVVRHQSGCPQIGQGFVRLTLFHFADRVVQSISSVPFALGPIALLRGGPFSRPQGRIVQCLQLP
jgi:hypothetical protein